ncbi:MAG: CRISPR-associated protein Cas2 [Enterococcus sp.]|nr:CRISPR-associated protein Cas2 [Enterococcus sp.]
MMMLLVCFDLPRDTKEMRKEANLYRKKLVDMGFTMKQYSLYERPIQKASIKEKVIQELEDKLPKSGVITLYSLPDEVNNEQIQILGENAIKKSFKKAQFIIL